MVAFPLVIGIGLASMLMINTINVTIQNAVPDALRGRVMALYVTVFAGTAPIGGLLAGCAGPGLRGAGRVQRRRRVGGRRARVGRVEPAGRGAGGPSSRGLRTGPP